MTQTNYNKKYKDRDPAETVKIIKDFFNSYNFEVKEERITDFFNATNCWSSTIGLYYKDRKILEQRGKGTTKDFCLASGYAELYERFANRLKVYSDFRLVKLLQEASKNKHDYYLSDTEIPLDCSLHLDNFLESHYHSKQLGDLLINFDTANKPVAVKYTSLTAESDAYFNPILLTNAIGSNGLAAGNTLQEALVQGIAELLERYSICLLDEELPQELHKINSSIINDDVIQSLLRVFDQNNYKVTIIDLSYTYNIPVILTIIYSSSNKKIFYSFGAHPIPEVAIERCLTEVFQDVLTKDSLEDDLRTKEELKNKQVSLFDVTQTHNCPCNILPETLFLYAVEETKFGNAFLKCSDYTNTELLNYCVNLFKTNGWNLYYLDNSICTKMSAVQIYCPEFCQVFIPTCECTDVPATEQALNYWTNNIEHSQNFYSDFNFDISLNSIPVALFDYFGETSTYKHLDWQLKTCVEAKQEHNFLNLDCLMTVYNASEYTLYADCLEPYRNMFRYRLMGYNKLSVQNIFDFMDDVFIDNIWDDCINIEALIKKVIYPEFKKNYSDEFLLEILKPFLGVDNDESNL